MKLFAATILAGAMAVSALAAGPGETGPKPAGLTWEHYAWASYLEGDLDGPRREAAGRGAGVLDAGFNAWVGGRCIRASDGQVITFAGGQPSFDADEGPAAYLPPLGPIRGTGYGQGIGGWIVKGLPLKGEQAGCLYAYSDSAVMKVWQNAAKGGRWWYRILAGPGKADIPGGQIYTGQIWRDPKDKAEHAVFFTKAGFYRLDEADGAATFTCLLSMDAMAPSFVKDDKTSRTPAPTLGAIDSGGNFYLGFYFSAYGSKTVPGVMKVAAGQTRAVGWVTPPGGCGAKKGQDGAGLKTGWHCGPHFRAPRAVSPWYPPGILLISAHDEHVLRRVTPDGRVSTLFDDGQWREAAGYNTRIEVDGVAGFVYGANGWALACSTNEGKSHKRGEGIYLVKGIDMGAPTAGAPGK